MVSVYLSFEGRAEIRMMSHLSDDESLIAI